MLSLQLVHQYREQGYCFVPGVFGQDSLDGFRRAADELKRIVSPIERGKPRLQVEKELDDGRARLRMIEPLIDLSPLFRDLCADRRILGMVEQIFSEPAYLFEDKLNYKPARVGSGFPLHQDWSYWSRHSKNLLSLFIHLDDAPIETGCMKLVPGTHKMGLLNTEADGHHIGADEIDRKQILTFEAKAGDVLIFHCLTAHESEPNLSDNERRALVISYNPCSDGNQYRYSPELLSTYH